ncbi:arylacetamide deacetylase-like [Branchiostoma floridae x Branchiostoma japonicum]
MDLMEVAMAMSVLSVLAYWRYCTPGPPGGVSERERRRVDICMQRLVVDIAAFLEFLGLATGISVLRAFLECKFRLEETITIPESLLKVTETTFDGVKVMVLEPQSAQKQSDVPGLVFFHPGAFCVGSSAVNFDTTSHIALELGIVIVSVE